MNMNTHWRKFARTQSIGTLSTTLDVIRHTIDHSINADNEDCNANNDTNNNSDNNDNGNNDNGLIGGITGDDDTTGDGVGPTISSYAITINDDENNKVPFKKLSTNTNTNTNLIHIAEDSKNNSDYQARFGFFSKDGDNEKYFLTLYDDNKTLYFDSINSISFINRTDSFIGFTIKYIENETVYRTENTTIEVTPIADN